MRTNVIGLVLFGLITVGLATGGIQYMDFSKQENNVDDTTLSTDYRADESGAEGFGYYVDPVMTEEEVIAIANSLEEVQNYTSIYETDVVAYFDGYGTWTVEYYQISEGMTGEPVTAEQATETSPVGEEPVAPEEPIYYSEAALYVWIDDATGAVLEVYEQEPYVPIDPEVLDAAMDFVSGNYLGDISTMDVYGEQFGDEIYLSGYDYTSDSWFTATLLYDEEFSLISLFASFEFGSPVHTLQEAEDIVLATPEAQNLTEVSNTTVSTSEALTIVDGNEVYSFFVSIVQDMYYGEEVSVSDPDDGGMEVNQGETSDPGDDPVDPGYPGDEYYAPTGYLFAEVDDATGEIVFMDYYPVVLPDSTEEEVMAVALADPQIQAWIESVESYNTYTYFYNGIWEVSFESQNFERWAYIQIEDGSLDVMYVYAPIPQPATHTEQEVRTLADSNGLAEFLDANPDAVVEIYYDGFGYWWVSAYSPVFIEEYFFMEILDSDLSVLYTYVSHMEIPPTMTTEEVIALVEATDEYSEFMATNPTATVHVYYWGGMWYVDIYDDVTLDQQISFVVDDTSGEIVDIYTYGPEEREG